MRPLSSAAGALLLSLAGATAWGIELPNPPGVQIARDADGVVIRVVVDPADLTVRTDRVELAGWHLTPGLKEPPLPLGVVLVGGEGWRITGVDLGSVDVMPGVRLEPVGAAPATLPPPGLDQAAWNELTAGGVASRWRGAAERTRSPAQLAAPLCRGGRCWTRVLLEPVRWDADGRRLEIDSNFTIRLEPVKEGSQELPSGVTAPAPPYLAADPQFTPHALKVDQAEGLVHLEWSELGTLLGWPLGSLDASRIQVWADGSQVAIDVAPGQWVELFVQPRTEEDVAGEFRRGDWTDERDYWFVVGDGSVTSSRVSTRGAAPAGGTPVAEYRSTVRLRDEHDCRFISAHVPSVDDEIFHWRTAAWSSFYSPSEYLAGLALDLPGLRAGSATPIELSVRLLGAASLASLSPQHRQRFWLQDGSGTPLAEVLEAGFDFDGDIHHDDVFTLDPADVAASDGVLYAASVDPHDRCVGACPGFLWDITYVDWVDVTYPREPRAVDGACMITPDGAGSVRFQVADFSGATADAIRLWDVTDPAAPVRLDGWTYSAGVVDFQDAAGDASRYLATDSSAWLHPGVGDVRAATAHDWAAGPAGGADWIVIGPRELVTSAAVAQLEAVRIGQGLRTARIPVEEVYDEFSGGAPTPWAVRSFVAWAADHWTPPGPSRLLLVGDATFDTKDQARPCSANCTDTDPTNDVFAPADFPDPSMPTWTEVVPGDASGLGVLGSDSWYGRVDGDAMPDLAVGRLPGRDAASLEVMVNRLLADEAAQPVTDPWTIRFEYVAGARDAAALEPIVDQAAAALPPAFEASRIHFAQSPWNATTADADSNGVSDMVDRMNEGRVVVNWLGHSGFQALEAYSGGTALELEDLQAPGADLQGETALFTAGACYVGAFHHPTAQPTLAEALLGAEEGGAASVLAHAASSYVYAADELIGGVQDRLTGLERSKLVGDAFLEAVWRCLTAGHDVEAESLVLFGDPSMNVPVPDPEAPAFLWVVDQSCSRVSLAWTPVAGTVSYTLFRSVGGGSYEAVLAGLPEPHAVDGLAPPAAEVRYRVSATAANGFASGGSPEVAVTTPPGPGSGGDQNCSCTLEAADLAAWVVHWYAVPREDPCDSADVNGDAAVTTGDLAALAALFY